MDWNVRPDFELLHVFISKRECVVSGFWRYNGRPSGTGYQSENSLNWMQKENPDLLLDILLSSVVQIYTAAVFRCANSDGIGH